MKKTLIIGEHASKKEKLIRLLLNKDIEIRKALAINYYDYLVDTPSEFLENKSFSKALITASFDCECIFLVIHATQKSTYFPPNFAPLFNIPVMGIITYENTELSEQEQKRAELFLSNAGVKTVYLVNIQTGHGLQALKKAIAK